MNVYSVSYRRDATTRRIYRVTVHANDTDEARAKAAIRDPLYQSSVAVKNRGTIVKAVVPPPLVCFTCHKPITDDLWTNVNFGKTLGLQTICDTCWERAS